MWDALGAIAGIIALILFIIVEWEKFPKSIRQICGFVAFVGIGLGGGSLVIAGLSNSDLDGGIVGIIVLCVLPLIIIGFMFSVKDKWFM